MKPRGFVPIAGSLENHEWTAQYHQHPIVCGAAAGEQVWSVALYVDGVPFQKQDGLIAFYGYNLVSLQRHLLLVWRRSDVCSCGCLGWCSLHVIMRCLEWSFQPLTAGQRPRVRHDGTPFTERETFRAAKGGTPLPKGCLVYLKVDWSEFVHTFGLPSWNSNLHPCPCCSASADELCEVGATSVVSGPRSDKTFEDCDRACADCEFKVVDNTRVDLHKLAGSLHYVQRCQGNHGRTLSVALPSLGLLKGDRLEPSGNLMDVGQLESVTTFSLWLTFWRQANETIARHRNPLFSRDTHTSRPAPLRWIRSTACTWESTKTTALPCW